MFALFVFLLGMFFGAGLIMAYGAYQVHKIRKVKDSLIAQIKAKAAEAEQKKGSIQARLVKAAEIAQEQANIRSQMEMPSKNALHSRYKNGLVGEIQDLEQQKLDILKSVLADGYDPMIVTQNENGTKGEIPLSAYVNEAELALADSLGETLPTDPNRPKKSGKFIVYKGGKDDGTTH